MDIELKYITVRELTKAYEDKGDEGIYGYGGSLDIRPPYQREFIYKPKQRDEVIKTLHKGFPLNVMYWSVTGHDKFEIIDGQQRTISICQFINNDFSVDFNGRSLMFHSLPSDLQDDILNYKLTVYQCKGTDSEKLDWFQTINIAGEELTKQELRNAVYCGEWVTNAKRYFSKRQNPAQEVYGSYLSGTANRQDFLETVIKWIAERDNLTIEQYMTKHQHDADASELWAYFQSVFSWVQTIFNSTKKERIKLMKGQDWGVLYNHYKENSFDAQNMERRIIELIDDDEVDNKKGIYPYLITGKEKWLSLRSFDEKDRNKMYQTQAGICPSCKEPFELSEMQADHIVPWSLGGKTNLDNGQMLCRLCNQTKGAN